MEEVSKVIIKPLQQSIYMKPYTMHFVQNGVKRTWDLLTIHDSVAILLYNISRNVLIFVKQFRPAVYFGSIPEEDRKFDEEIDMKKYPPSLGVTLELCAGIIDKQKSEEVIAKEEVLEECGYDVPISSLEKIGLYRSGVGTSASLQTAFYCEVTDEMKVSAGGGVDDEIIEVVEMTVGDIKKYVTQDYIKSPPSFMFAIYWFLYHKQNNVN
ncbi:uridine diphosphate glucose pyrophosphatase NUDT14-like [Diorhabda sublineata]|uniref:uridine diphosphate glucose pyrophosphatase NUDT14-like n=1 Tax=Diorhabda sublineata TaxID=1163346 RepID=UPI0024E17E45|nr:uridine diphosphate glucose pyrophosphatase NUDT14-like [Diorhabda sublineata]